MVGEYRKGSPLDLMYSVVCENCGAQRRRHLNLAIDLDGVPFRLGSKEPCPSLIREADGVFSSFKGSTILP
jgi:hypothetical protein